MNNNTIDGALLFAQNAISNAINQAVLKPYFDEYGYTAEKLQEGDLLYKKAEEAHKVQKKEYGDQYAATSDLDIAKANADKVYKKHLKVARIALGNAPGPVNALQLGGIRLRTLSGWLSQAKAFYANGIKDPVVLEALGKYNITKEKLAAGQELILECEVKHNTQLKEKGEAQTATKMRDNAVDELARWMSDFTGIARIALEENPQYLEMLGIVAPS
jgi:hypothetical protein